MAAVLTKTNSRALALSLSVTAKLLVSTTKTVGTDKLEGAEVYVFS